MKKHIKKKIRDAGPCRKSFEMEIASGLVKERIEEAYKVVAKSASVPGFRPGKAPRHMLEKHYGEKVTQNVIEDLIPETYSEALKESSLVPLDFPAVSDVDLTDDKTLKFRAEVDIRPSLDLKSYKGLKASKKKVRIKDEDVEKSLASLRESNAKFVNSETGVVNLGDYIICDSEIFVDDKSIAKKRENIWMPIEEQSYIPDLAKRLVGAKIGEKKEVEVTLPENFPYKDHVNKKAVVKIDIKEVKVKSMPEVNDEFAKDMGCKDMAGLKETIAKALEAQADQQAEAAVEGQILEQMLKSCKFDVPSSFVDRQTEYLMNESKQKLLRQGLKEEDIKKEEGKLKEQCADQAAKQVRIMFILDEIAKRENISATDKEVEAALDNIARSANQTRAKVEQYYKEKDLLSNLRANIREKKVIQFLVKEANITTEGG